MVVKSFLHMMPWNDATSSSLYVSVPVALWTSLQTFLVWITSYGAITEAMHEWYLNATVRAVQSFQGNDFKLVSYKVEYRSVNFLKQTDMYLTSFLQVVGNVHSENNNL